MVLVDTHILLWIFSDSSRLTANAKKALENNDACISIASLWEMAIKSSLPNESKRLELKDTIQDIAKVCQDQGIDILPVTPDDCQRIRLLPYHHADPFDRNIMAQAIERGMALITKDENIRKYDEVNCIW